MGMFSCYCLLVSDGCVEEAIVLQDRFEYGVLFFIDGAFVCVCDVHGRGL